MDHSQVSHYSSLVHPISSRAGQDNCKGTPHITGTPVTKSNIKQAIATLDSRHSFMQGSTVVNVPADTAHRVDITTLPSSLLGLTGLWLNEEWIHCQYYGDQTRYKSSTFFVSTCVCFNVN